MIPARRRGLEYAIDDYDYIDQCRAMNSRQYPIINTTPEDADTAAARGAPSEYVDYLREKMVADYKRDVAAISGSVANNYVGRLNENDLPHLSGIEVTEFERNTGFFIREKERGIKIKFLK